MFWGEKEGVGVIGDSLVEFGRSYTIEKFLRFKEDSFTVLFIEFNVRSVVVIFAGRYWLEGVRGIFGVIGCVYTSGFERVV